MEINENELRQLPFEEVVFEHRNREYGAYFLRKTYKKRLNKAMTIGIIFLLIATVGPFIYYSSAAGRTKEDTKDVKIELIDIQKPDEDAPPPPPPPPPPPAIEQVKFTAPVVVDSVEEGNKVDLGTVDDLKNQVSNENLDTAKITVVKQEEKQEVVVEEKKQEAFMIVEEMPEFPGGAGELHKFIAQNIQYPPAARENGIQGKVYVRFVVTSDGSIDQISIVRKVDDLLEAEAIRVIKAMPKWKPGKQRGQPVNVWYTAPIIFVLN